LIYDWTSLRRVVNQYGKTPLPATEEEAGFTFVNYKPEPTHDGYTLLVDLREAQDGAKRVDINPYGVDHVNCKRRDGVRDVYVEVELTNYQDQVLVEHGYRDASSIRKERVRLWADSGSTLLALPQDLVERLGLRITDQKVIVTYADEWKAERPVARGVTVEVGDRSMITECLVGPPRSEPWLGQIILERLDLFVNCAEGKLVPRPESPYLPLFEVEGIAGHTPHQRD